MKHIKKIKITVDVCMFILVLRQMAYHMTANRVHEWTGAVAFALFILHNALNWRWYRKLFQGKYASSRILHTTINLLLALSILGMISSGMMLSRQVFGFMGLRAGRLGRKLHMLCTAWGYVLMAAHMGLHWNMVVSRFGKICGKLSPQTPLLLFLPGVVAVLTSAYGIFAFIKRHVYDHLFLLVEYAYFDFNEPMWRFFIDQITIFIAFGSLAYYGSKWLKHRTLHGRLKKATPTTGRSAPTQ